MKKTLSLLIAVLLLCSCVASASADSSNSEVIENAHKQIVDIYDSSQYAPQQTSAAAQGAMCMLKFILEEISSNQTRRDAVSDVVSAAIDEINKSETAQEVSAHCLDACVFTLGAIAYEKDSSGQYSEFIDAVMHDLANENPGSAEKEMALASYWMDDLLEIIALEAGVSSSTVEEIEGRADETDRGTDNALQQTVNGLYHAAELISYIADEDCSGTIADQITDLLNGMYDDDNKCEGVEQQMANGMSTIYLMLYAVAMDKA